MKIRNPVMMIALVLIVFFGPQIALIVAMAQIDQIIFASGFDATRGNECIAIIAFVLTTVALLYASASLLDRYTPIRRCECCG